eukprot:2972273-Pyramimonas_sp.AAC.1
MGRGNSKICFCDPSGLRLRQDAAAHLTMQSSGEIGPLAPQSRQPDVLADSGNMSEIISERVPKIDNQENAPRAHSCKPQWE